MEDVEQHYDNHFDEWIEEENEKRYDRDQAKRSIYFHPHDPNFIPPKETKDDE